MLRCFISETFFPFSPCLQSTSWFVLVLAAHRYLFVTLWARVCSPRQLLLPHQRKPPANSALSRVTGFTLYMLCRMCLISSCCVLSGWCPFSRKALFSQEGFSYNEMMIQINYCLCVYVYVMCVCMCVYV